MKKMNKNFTAIFFLYFLLIFSASANSIERFSWFPDDVKKTKQRFNTLTWERKLIILRTNLPNTFFLQVNPLSKDIFILNEDGSGLDIHLGKGNESSESIWQDEKNVNKFNWIINNNKFVIYDAKFKIEYKDIIAVDFAKNWGKLPGFALSFLIKNKETNDLLFTITPIKNPSPTMIKAVNYWKKKYGMK